MHDSSNQLTRRKLLGAGAAATGLAGAGAFLSMDALAQDKVKVNMQLGWIAGGNQIGEVAAKQLGYYATEGIDFAIQPGGPSIDGVAIVASGRWEVGQVSSSPSNMLAVSQDLPIKVFATGLQQHPYTFFSLKKNPIRTPKDMIGKKIGIQSTGLVLLRALLAKNKIDEKSMTIIPIGADVTPLLTGQVDTVTGWQTNTTALKPLGADRVDMRLWDTGVHLYALPYYATTDMIQRRPVALARFLRASARGWAYANKNRVQHQHLQQRLGRHGPHRLARPDPAIRRSGAVHQTRAQGRRSDDHGHPERHARIPAAQFLSARTGTPP